MTLTEMFNVCDMCAHSPSFCDCEPGICVKRRSELILAQKEEADNEAD